MSTLSMDGVVNVTEETVFVATTIHLSITWQVVAVLCLTVVTIVSNFVILVAFYDERKLRTYSNYYIINMTVADFLVGLVCMPIRATFLLLGRTWVLGQTFCHVFIGLQHALQGVSVFGIVVICFDRYLATSYPLHHFKMKNKRSAMIANMFTWLLPFAVWLGIGPLWDFLRPTGRRDASGSCLPNYATNFVASVVVVILRSIIPFVAVTVLCIRIYYSTMMAGNLTSGNDRRYLHSEKDSSEESFPRSTLAGNSLAKSGRSQKIANISSDFEESKVSGRRKLGESQEAERHVEKHLQEGSGERQVFTNQSKELAIFPTILLEREEPSSFGRTLVSGNSRATSNQRNMSTAPSTSKGNKAIRTLTFVVVTFFLTWLPATLTLVLYSFDSSLITRLSYSTELRNIVRWISYGNSTLNPLAYALAQPLLRLTIFKVCCNKCSLRNAADQ
ncbi:muscarinic acetylcholine receptor M1-like [Diadema setosum]|uniref:muscarinic acetylcholine receptor M1-like n=1 Tax=Diadema setosum TaxID=31175 RepID=UPI003B3B959D